MQVAVDNYNHNHNHRNSSSSSSSSSHVHTAGVTATYASSPGSGSASADNNSNTAITSNDSILNRQPKGCMSLYHQCRQVLRGLGAVPGFSDYLEDAERQPINDPVTKLWNICRQGSSLCLLFNTLEPKSPIAFVQEGASLKPKACVYHFIIACRNQLGFDQGSLFTLSDLFQDDTNGFVKVVTTVQHILEMLHHNDIIDIQSSSSSAPADPNAPKDIRGKVVFELLETERKYVQDLESLQHYMREAHEQKVLPPDTLHQLFGNLNALVDFQRKFLIQAEDNADRSPQEQHFGYLFIQLEEAFGVYEPFCANSLTAQQLVVQERAKLEKLSSILDPGYELPSILIKPVQRICKYPLLLQEMIKSTPEDWSNYEEMEVGLETVRRIASKVNETMRREENNIVFEELKTRIDYGDKDYDVDRAGRLLLHDKFMLYRSGRGQEMLVYLFETALVICKEDTKESNKKVNAISISSRKNKKLKDDTIYLRGVIFVSKIAQAANITQNGEWTLRVFWSEKEPQPHNLQSFSLRSFEIKCRNEDHLQQWESALNKLIQKEKRLSRESRALAEAQALKQYQHQHHQPRTPARGHYEQNYLSMTYDGENDDLSDDAEGDGYSESESVDEQQDTMRRFRSQSQGVWRAPENSTSTDRRQQAMSTPAPRYGTTGNVPGMTLPPLPRNGTEDSPPLSNPSSPMLSSFHSPSTRASSYSSSSSAGSCLSYPAQRRSNGHLLATEMIGHSMMNGDTHLIPPSSDDYNTPDGFTRIRSHSNASAYTMDFDTSDNSTVMTANSRTLYHVEEPLSNIKVKLNFLGEIYVVVVPLTIEYTELLQRITRKIEQCGRTISRDTVGLKYEDEDGDLITISSDEDLQLGFETRGFTNTVSFLVTTVSA